MVEARRSRVGVAVEVLWVVLLVYRYQFSVDSIEASVETEVLPSTDGPSSVRELASVCFEHRLGGAISSWLPASADGGVVPVALRKEAAHVGGVHLGLVVITVVN